MVVFRSGLEDPNRCSPFVSPSSALRLACACVRTPAFHGACTVGSLFSRVLVGPQPARQLPTAPEPGQWAVKAAWRTSFHG